MQHSQQKPFNITANGTTPVSFTIPGELRGKNGLEFYNPDTTQVCFISVGKGDQTPDSTCNFIPAGARKVVRIDPYADTISIVFPAASTVVVRAVPVGAFDELGF